MYNFPDTVKKIKGRISRYKSALNKEKKAYGCYRDGDGKRYELFSLYFVLNDLKKSDAYFEWYNKEFPDDTGDPIQKLCYAISLHRLGKQDEAKRMLADLMISNLYMIPYLIGQDVNEYDMWHSSNRTECDYVEYIPLSVLMGIHGHEIEWMRGLYDSVDFRRIRERHIEIFHELKSVNDFEMRIRLVNEANFLLDRLRMTPTIMYDEIVSWSNPGAGFESRCRIRIVKLNSDGTVTHLKNYYIVASDLGADTGTSITNSAPVLIPMICREHNIDLAEMVWFEHYPHEGRGIEPTLDVVTPGPDSSCCGSSCSQMVSVDWRPARPNEIKHLKQFIPDIV